MSRYTFFAAAVLSVALSAPAFSRAQSLAPTPPMGWNSWDSYGLTIDETSSRPMPRSLPGSSSMDGSMPSSTRVGTWQDPRRQRRSSDKYLWDGNGLLIPAPDRFPSAADGAGFRPLADWLHAQGLKFGIHIVRGIPRQVVAANLPIAGTSFHAADAADTTSPCPWDEGNWGVKDNAAGQAYYDSMLRLYARWGARLSQGGLHRRPSLPAHRDSPDCRGHPQDRPADRAQPFAGPTALDHAAEVPKYAQMWRIADDHWDGWTFRAQAGGGEFPFGIREPSTAWPSGIPTGAGQLAGCRHAARGWLGPHPGLGRRAAVAPHPRRTAHRVHALGHRALAADSGRQPHPARRFHPLAHHQPDRALHQPERNLQPAGRHRQLGPGFENARVWRATINEPGARGYAEYFAFFNLDDKPATLRTTWKQLGLDGAKHSATNALGRLRHQRIKGDRSHASRPRQRPVRSALSRIRCRPPCCAKLNLVREPSPSYRGVLPAGATMPVLRSAFIALSHNRPLRRFCEHSRLWGPASARASSPAWRSDDALRVAEASTARASPSPSTRWAKASPLRVEAHRAAEIYHQLLDCHRRAQARRQHQRQAHPDGPGALSPALAETIAGASPSMPAPLATLCASIWKTPRLTQVTLDIVRRLHARAGCAAPSASSSGLSLPLPGRHRATARRRHPRAPLQRRLQGAGRGRLPAQSRRGRKLHPARARCCSTAPSTTRLATHDETMIAAAKAYAARKRSTPSHFEFQMLYGVRRDLQRKLVSEGYKVRVYVPFGSEWYPYFMRRLAERPPMSCSWPGTSSIHRCQAKR